jgi:membrane-bound serine protease (ClpP class)
MAVFVIGLLLVLSELLLHPGTVIPGVVGALMMIGSLVWAMIDRYPGEGWWPNGDMLTRPLLNLGLAFLGGVFAIYLLAKMLPRTSLYGHIVLGAASGAATASRVPVVNSRVPIGATGVAQTMLRPSGKADFDGERCDVVTRGEFLEAGAKVRVAEIDGTRVVVEPV